MTRKATCCCGKCSIEVEGEPTMNALCHCCSCKRRSGSAFGWSAYFADDKVLGVAGDLKVYAISVPAPAQRSFCSNCGSTLFWKADIFPGHTGVAGGCFADAPLEEPALTASNEGKCAWVGLPDHWLKVP
jgi:hypothetical protein